VSISSRKKSKGFIPVVTIQVNLSQLAGFLAE